MPSRTDIADNGYRASSSCSTRTETPTSWAQRRTAPTSTIRGDTVAGRVNDDVESDRDDELAHDTEDFARTAAVPRIVGYTGGHVEADTNRFFISKIYLLKRNTAGRACARPPSASTSASPASAVWMPSTSR